MSGTVRYLPPWKGESEQSCVLALPVYLHNPTYKMTALSLGEQQLWINEVHHQANEKVRVCIYSSDVSLTLQQARANEHS